MADDDDGDRYVSAATSLAALAAALAPRSAAEYRRAASALNLGARIDDGAEDQAKLLYVASSWKNPHQPRVVAALSEAGHAVYDFRKPAPGESGFHWSETGAPPPPWDARTYRHVLSHPLARKGFELDMRALRWCDAVVLLLPAGRSAAWELGWAMGQGKPACILMEEPTNDPELMFSGAEIVGSLDELLAWLCP